MVRRRRAGDDDDDDDNGGGDSSRGRSPPVYAAYNIFGRGNNN